MSEKVAAIENIKQMTNAQKEQYLNGILHYKNEYERGRKETDAVSVTAAFHNLIDEEWEKSLKEETVSCHRGCSFCCFIHNEITEDEAGMLVEYSKEINYPVDKDLLLKQKGKTLEEYRKMPAIDRKCVFLVNGECGVYEHRPSSCRKYYVKSDPKLCDLDNGLSDDVLVLLNNMAEIIFAGQGLAQRTGLIADLLLEKL